jgi:hypothetical protein
MPKATRITLETETMLVIQSAKAVSEWCPGCHAEVDVITLDSGLTERGIAAQIQEWLGTGKLHLWHTTNRTTQICLTSLFRCFELDQIQRIFRSNEIPLNPSRRRQS